MKKTLFILSLLLFTLPMIAHANTQLVHGYFFTEDFESGMDGWKRNDVGITGNKSDHDAKLSACTGCKDDGYAWLSTNIVIPSNYMYPIFEYDRKTKNMGLFDIDDDFFNVAWRPVGSDNWDILETINVNDNWETKIYKLFERPLWSDDIDEIEIKFKLRNKGWERWSTCDYAYIDNVKLSGFHTPEPATLTLMGMGILGLFGFYRKKAL